MHYCHRKCQKLDWIEGHRNECSIMASNGQTLQRDCDRFLLRLWLSSQSKGRQSETHELFNGMKRSLDDLMTHHLDIKKDSKRMNFFGDICKRFRSCDLEFDGEQLFELFCKICINSFSILNEDLNEIGTGLYLCGSILNHSCAPNAAPVFNGIDLEVRAIRQIESHEEILINYVDLKLNKEQRQSRLSEQYYFDCNCSKCANDSDSHIDYELLKQLNEEFDQLVSEQFNWQKCYEIGKKTIPLYHEIYGPFHPDLTVQLLRVLKVNALVAPSLDDPNIVAVIKKTRNSIKITHGLGHRLNDVFNEAIGL